MLNLIAASILTLATLADLESVTEEWIAPGVNITKETLIEFVDHGEMFQSDSEPYVGCHVTFVEVNGEEKWRAVVVYADRVILFQEDQNPLVTLHNFQVNNLCFSESGNYVVLHDGGAIDTDRNGLRINTETGESIFFDTQPEGLIGGRVLVVWNDGGAIIGLSLNWNSNLSRDYYLSRDLSATENHDFYYAWPFGISDNLIIVYHSKGLTGLNKNGTILWEHSIISRPTINSLPPITISDSGLFLIPTRLDVQLRSCETGILVNSYLLPEPGTFCNTPVFLGNGSDWLCSASTNDSSMEEWKQIILSAKVSEDQLSSQPFTVPYTNINVTTHTIRQVSDTNILIQKRNVSLGLPQQIITDENYSPLFVTQPVLLPSLDTGFQDWLSFAEVKLNTSGNRAFYQNLTGVFMLRIGE